MLTDEIMKTKRELEVKMAEVKREMRKRGKDFVRQCLLPIFEKYPLLEGIRWTQYTPYFNDGDECIFRSQHDDPQIKWNNESEFFENESNWDDDDEEAGWTEYYICQNWSEEKKKKMIWLTEITDILSSFTDDDMKTLFDDHVEVTVFRDRVEVTAYDHD